MIIYTDSVRYATRLFPEAGGWSSIPASFDPILGLLVNNLYHDRPIARTVIYSLDRWKYLFIVEKAASSHFDLLVRMVKENAELPDGLLCLAGSGTQFHGQRSRPWAAIEGNIHLAVNLTPRRKIDHIGVAFTVLSAVAVVEAIRPPDRWKGQVGIKWVNDILIDEAKVGGVLAHTQGIEDFVTSAVLGIGLNVEATPLITPDKFISEVSSLREKSDDPDRVQIDTVFQGLMQTLDANYRLLEEDHYLDLWEKYRSLSLITGRDVDILSDPVAGKQRIIASGIVSRIGENLELYLENQKEPVTKGRLVIKSPRPS